jgi:hypothetical protein
MAGIADMTLDDLKNFVEDTIDERLSRLLGKFEIPDDVDSDDDLTWDAIRESAEQHRWTPPPGAKSSLELLREDREG